MKTGRIAFGPNQQRKLEDAIERVRNPAPGVTLVSHGWSKRCAICEKHTHAKWHEFVTEALNPVALVQMIRSMNEAPEVRSRIVAHILAVTGMDLAAVEIAPAADAVDPVDAR